VFFFFLFFFDLLPSLALVFLFSLPR